MGGTLGDFYQRMYFFLENNLTQNPIKIYFSFTSVEDIMDLNEPKVITFWIAVVVAVIALIAFIVTIPVLSGIAFWLMLIAFVILAAGNLLKGV